MGRVLFLLANFWSTSGAEVYSSFKKTTLYESKTHNKTEFSWPIFFVSTTYLTDKKKQKKREKKTLLIP